MKIEKSRHRKIRIITTLCSIILTSCFLLSTFSFADFSLKGIIHLDKDVDEVIDELK